MRLRGTRAAASISHHPRTAHGWLFVVVHLSCSPAAVSCSGINKFCTSDADAIRARHELSVRVRVEIMGSQKCRIVGKSQSVLIMIDPITFTRTRM
jgi:hypothetical protein